MKIPKLTATLCAAAVLLLSAGCSPGNSKKANDILKNTEHTTAEPSGEKTQDEIYFGDIQTFELSSSDLHDGVWDTDITKTEKGSNRSPQLSWKPVEGAGLYVIYMIDTSAGNWLHWLSVSESETELPAGWAPGNEYVGPYPPGGTHDYDVYVFALKEPVERLKGGFDASNPKMFDFLKELDTSGGNIISYAHITGTYTYGD